MFSCPEKPFSPQVPGQDVLPVLSFSDTLKIWVKNLFVHPWSEMCMFSTLEIEFLMFARPNYNSLWTQAYKSQLF